VRRRARKPWLGLLQRQLLLQPPEQTKSDKRQKRFQRENPTNKKQQHLRLSKNQEGK